VVPVCDELRGRDTPPAGTNRRSELGVTRVELGTMSKVARLSQPEGLTMTNKYWVAHVVNEHPGETDMYPLLFGMLSSRVSAYFRGIAKQKDLYDLNRAIDEFLADHRAQVAGGMRIKDSIKLLASAYVETPAGSESPAGQGRTPA